MTERNRSTARRPNRPLNVDPVDWYMETVSRPDGDDGCWFTTMSENGKGRPRVCVNGRHVLLARLFWVARHGAVPEGLQLAHNCMNRRCVNPSHLRPTTQRDNQLDEFRAAGPPDYVATIRRMHAAGVAEHRIVAALGMAQSTVNDIINHRRWRNA
ncbi:MAG: HNH endonuclease [Acidobacteria bacterium]|nr:HNH endonuclease [Acidobacteriota bacterium]